MNRILDVTLLLVLIPMVASVIDYPYSTAEPQKSGWPLTAEERAYVVEKPEHDRRPGRESNKHLPHLWPVVPSAGHFGGDSWLKLHEAHVKTVQANAGPIDVLLVGDSITIQWGESWKKHFPDLKAVNIGIGGDKTQNVLWRLDHGGVEGIEPKAIVLMIGNNNMFFTPETGIEAAARGIEMCVKNLREKFPRAKIVVSKILPAHAPDHPFYRDIKATNELLDGFKLNSDPQLQVLDLTQDFVNSDGTLKKELYTSDNIHLSAAGYSQYAARLKPLLEAMLAGKPVPAQPMNRGSLNASTSTTKEARASFAPKAAANLIIPSRPVVTYPYAPYNEGKMDPQLTGWPLTLEELDWVAKEEYFRKPGHELQKHLPEMWFLTPTAARWGNEGEPNLWIEHHAKCIEKVQAMKDSIDIALIGDSITQGWGGGWDGSEFNSVWKKHFAAHDSVNLGIGGDRIENILWRLDHGLLDGTSPKFIVLMVGVNNAPLVQANGVPANTAAEGIKLCIDNLRQRCPQSKVVLIKVLPAFDPSKDVGEKVRVINTALDAMKLNADPQVQLLDLSRDFTNSDGSLKSQLYSDGHLHLNLDGYETLASSLKSVIDTQSK